MWLHPLLMPVTRGVVFLLNILCLMANKFCFLICFYIVFVACEPTFPSVEWAVKTHFIKSYSCVSVTNSCCCRCEELWFLQQVAFSCHLFVMHLVCEGLYRSRQTYPFNCRRWRVSYSYCIYIQHKLTPIKSCSMLQRERDRAHSIVHVCLRSPHSII